jgi:cell division protein FtsB
LQLEHHVNLMRGESLDLELLDQQARKILGYASPDEKVIILDNTD